MSGRRGPKWMGALKEAALSTTILMRKKGETSKNQYDFPRILVAS